MYEPPTRSRRFGPGLIALVVVLGIAAGTLGYVGMRVALGGTAQATTSGPPTRSGAPSRSAPASSTPATSGSVPASPPASTSPAAKPVVTVPPGDPTMCPSRTAAALTALGINADLTLLLYIRAGIKNVAPSEVWVCRNADGTLIYQGHVLSGPLTDPGSSLLLVDGVKGTVIPDGAGYLATNPDTPTGAPIEYSVQRDFLTVTDRLTGKLRFKYPVLLSAP